MVLFPASMITAAMQALVIKHRSLFISHGLFFGAAPGRSVGAAFSAILFNLHVKHRRIKYLFEPDHRGMATRTLTRRC